MSSKVDKELLWLAAFVCIPNWAEAARAATARTTALGFEMNLLRDGSLRDVSPRALLDIAHRLKGDHPTLSLAWRMLALRTSDDKALIHEVVGVVVSVVSSTDGDVTDALARLRVWDAVAAGKFTGDDFFKIAGQFWRGEREYIVARLDEENRCSGGIPVCVELLDQGRWDDAFAWLSAETARQAAKLGVGSPPSHADRKKQRILINAHVELLFAQGRHYTGELALAWQMMTCDPERPESFNAVLPQVTWLLQHWSIITSPIQKARLHDRLHVWWLAARGEWAGATKPVSIFRIAERETASCTYEDSGDFPLPEPDPEPEDLRPAPPTVVVMPARHAEEKGLPQAWKDLRDQPLPLVVCDDATWVREKLQDEYPHAYREIALLTQDLRDDEPVRMRPTLLLSPPGFGKTRVVRRLAEVISPQMYVYRFDAASSFDGMYGGTPKGWSSAQASVPARAIMMSKTANPISFVDEICKAGESQHNGNLWSAITPHLERETAARYRESGIDAEMNLSHVVHIATANSIERLPSQLRDRYRVIRIPSPTLAHLPRLAAIVVNELAVENDMYASHAIEPLAPDELEIIGRAWAKERFSLRKLRRLVEATLEARDACARRH
ncbi:MULTISPECIES: AAA family ATPase [Bradyrhizobium]|uniref:AAA family ATPase n=1 Tax=Bradyrhizobium TaxID=374 RepID=UPI00200D158D|nr:AAA family ATPase [Bradyrhizobium japonicum]UQE03482.1 AAA family ATPase [Bradyrhizobium japonicum]